jgi:carbonic anhydrase
MTPDRALTMLKEGNERWVKDSPTHPNTESSRREILAKDGQKPFATILTCSDSRLPVERLFDRGAGDVFVVRVAGNTAGSSETGTIEYGVGHLNTPLLVVMGHGKCGAVGAAASGGEVHGKVADIIHAIEPAVERAHRNHPDVEGDEFTAHAIKENVWQSIFDLLKQSEATREKVVKGDVRIIGAVCDITTGKVEWLGEHPWQAELMDALAKRQEKVATGSETPTPEEHH